MFKTTQQISDQLLGLLEAHPAPSPTVRAVTTKALSRLEGVDLHPRAFEHALAESPFVVEGDILVYQPSAVPVHQAIVQLVAHYLALVLPDDVAPMDINAAAVYLGMSVSGLKKIIYGGEDLIRYTTVGTGKRKSLLFTRQSLDDFQELSRPVGRPPKDKPAPAVKDDLAAVRTGLVRLASRIEDTHPALMEEILNLVDRIREGEFGK